MKLYYHPLSTYSQKVLFALYEKGMDVEREIVDIFDESAKAAFREVNPLGKVPVLIDDDHFVPEGSIIIEYLDRRGPPRLLSDDPDLSRRTRCRDRIYDLYLVANIDALAYEHMKPANERNEATVEAARRTIATIYNLMEQDLEDKPFNMGNDFTLADCGPATALFYARMLAPFDERPVVRAYWERLAARPAVSRVHEEAAPYLESLFR